MVVLAHVAGQSRALVDSNLVGTGSVGKHDEGIKCGGAIDRGGGRISAPPVVGCGNRGRRSGNWKVQIASIGCAVAGQAAEAHVNDQIGLSPDPESAATGIRSTTSRRRVPGYRHLRDVQILTGGIKPHTGSVATARTASTCARLVVADQCTCINN